MRLIMFFQIVNDGQSFCEWRKIKEDDVKNRLGLDMVIDFARSLPKWENCGFIGFSRETPEPDSPTEAHFRQSISDVGEGKERKRMFVKFYVGYQEETITRDEFCKIVNEILKYTPEYIKKYFNDIAQLPETTDTLIVDNIDQFTIAVYTKAIELDSNNAFAYHRRAIAYCNEGEYDRAIPDYTKAIELNPKYAVAYYNRGHAYGKKGEHDRAISDYTKAIELNPNLAVAYNNRAIAYYNKGDYYRAISDYTKAIELKPEYADAYYNRAKAYDKKGEESRAISDYKKFMEL